MVGGSWEPGKSTKLLNGRLIALLVVWRTPEEGGLSFFDAAQPQPQRNATQEGLCGRSMSVHRKIIGYRCWAKDQDSEHLIQLWVS